MIYKRIQIRAARCANIGGHDAAGGKTQLVSVVAARATGAVAVFFAAQLGYLPQAALAAVLIFSAFGLLDLRASWQLRTIDRFELRLSILTTVGVLTVGVLPGVVLAILLALFNVLARIYKPQDAILGWVPGLDGYNDIGLDPRSETLSGVILYRFEGPRSFVLSVESVTQLDTSGIQALEVIHSELKAEGIQLLVARPKLYMRCYGESTGIGLRVGRESVFPSVRAAVEAMPARHGIPAVEVPDRSFRAFSITSGAVSNRRT